MARPLTLGLLVPLCHGPVAPPEARPLGRAALRLAGEGIGVVFGERLAGGRMSGWVARPGAWEPVEGEPIAALYDRFPSQSFPARFAAALAGAGDLPVGNPSALTALCRDKLACQARLEASGLALPAVEADPARFEATLARWGAAFLKPRFGGLGRGVRRVLPGDPLPAEGEGAVPGVLEPLILQRAVPPPAGWAGWCLRVLVQREVDGGWVVPACALRASRADPVVNVARGAEVLPAEAALAPVALAAARTLAVAAAQALAAGREPALELGVDAVVDDRGGLHLIEVNGRPRGRLEALADLDSGRWGEAHVEACCRPLRRLRRIASGAIPRAPG